MRSGPTSRYLYIWRVFRLGLIACGAHRVSRMMIGILTELTDDHPLFPCKVTAITEDDGLLRTEIHILVFRPLFVLCIAGLDLVLLPSIEEVAEILVDVL